MIKEQAKELLPIIQAWVDGKTVQFLSSSGEWMDIASKDFIDFNSTNRKLRIKPEPREFWIALSKENVTFSRTYKITPENFDGCEIIHVKEVI